MTSAVTTSNLTELAGVYAHAQRELDTARDELHAAVAQAIDVDHLPVAQVARTIGVSKARIYGILTRHYSAAG